MTPARQPEVEPCAACGAPLASDQRYCLHCGQRRGAPRVDPLGALGFAGDAAAAAPPAPVPPRRRRPSARLAAALAAATFGVGIAAGAALGPSPTAGVAAAPQRVLALVTFAQAPATPEVTTPAATEPATPETPATPEASPGDTSTPTAASPATSTTTGDTTTADDTSGDEPAGVTPESTATTLDTASDTTPAATTPAAVPSVWVLQLAALDPAAWAAPSPLADLAAQGTLLTGYAPPGTDPAAANLALLGGIAPAPDCVTALAACVRPATDDSLPGQLTTAGRTWKAYVQDPNTRCGATWATVGPTLFHALADGAACTTHVVGFEALADDLHAADGTPPFSLLVPDACHDASPDPCQPGFPVGPDSASDLVHALVAQITASPAYQAGGVLVILPATASPAAPVPGALVLSPRAAAGRVVPAPTGPLGLLRSLDELYVLKPLGAAAAAPTGALDDVLAPAAATPRSLPTPTRRIN